MAIEPLPSDPALEPLAWTHPIVQEWFLSKFGSATEPQIAGWPAILRGDPTLIPELLCANALATRIPQPAPSPGLFS